MLDTNGNGQWDNSAGGDANFWLGNAQYLPVVGDWNGSGLSKAGVFSGGWWYLDVNGDGQWSAGINTVFFFGASGDVPITGDWSGSGLTNIGVFRSGFWILDMNGNGQIDGIGVGEAGFWLGNSAYTPVVMRERSSTVSPQSCATNLQRLLKNNSASKLYHRLQALGWHTSCLLSPFSAISSACGIRRGLGLFRLQLQLPRLAHQIMPEAVVPLLPNQMETGFFVRVNSRAQIPLRPQRDGLIASLTREANTFVHQPATYSKSAR
jgi:hypothetical protein